MSIKSFRNTTTADIATGHNTRAARAIPQLVWKAAQRKIDALRASTSLNDLRLPGLRLEPLKGSLLGFYSIRINDQYRVIFRYEKGEAFDVEVIDYHRK